MLIKQNNLIFSLDDFGISRKANERILQLLETGKIDRVSVMPHGVMNEDEVKRILASKTKLDVHVDLRNDIDPKRKLKDGVAKRLVLFSLDYFSGKKSDVVIEKQWEEQIKSFQKIFNRNPDGINSHQHIHFFPPYFKIALFLSEKYGINYIRFGDKSYRKNSLVCLIIDWFRKKNLESFLASNLFSSQMVVSFDWIDNFDALNEYSMHNEIEVVFHPERDEEMIFLKSVTEN